MDIAFDRLKAIVGDGLERVYEEVANIHIDLVNGPVNFSIRIFELSDGRFFSQLSHYYWGPEQIRPYVSSRTEVGTSIQDVFESELRKLCIYYNEKAPANKSLWQRADSINQYDDAFGGTLTIDEANERHFSK
jgi:hypothetical protein